MIDQPVAGTPIVPEWLANLAALGWRILVVVALLVAAAYVAGVLATVTATMLLSFIFAAAFAPLAQALRDRGWSHSKAAGVVTVGGLALVLATLIVIALAFVPYVGQLLDGIRSALDHLRAAIADASFPPEIANMIQTFGTSATEWATAQVAAAVGPIAEIVTVAILSIFLVFYLLADGDAAWSWGVQPGADWQRDRVTAAGRDAVQRVGGYVRGLAILAAVNAGRDFVLLVILGVPLAGPLAVLVFLLGFIPYFGGLVATGLILLVTWATVGPQAALAFLVVIAILNVFEANVLRPLVFGRTVHIHPAVALVTILAGAALGGIVGVAVAIPLVALAIALTGSLIAVLDTEPAATRMTLVPAWLERTAQWSWRLLVALALIGLVMLVFQQAPTVVVPLVLALILASTLLPLVERLVARGWKRGRASLVSTIGAIGTIGAIVVLSVVAMLPKLGDMVSRTGEGAATVGANSDGTLGWLGSVVQTYGLGAVSAISTILVGVATTALGLLITTVLCFYFLNDGHRAWAALMARFPASRRAEVARSGSKAVDVLGGYMIATGVISLFAASTQFVIMTLLGLPLAVPLAIFAIFVGFIPIVGGVITSIAVILITIAAGTPTQIVIVAIWTVVFNIVEGNIVTPLVYGRAVNIHPAVILLALPAGSAIAGVLGMVLVVPFIGIISETWRVVLHVFGPVATGTEPAGGERPPGEAMATAPEGPAGAGGIAGPAAIPG